MSLPKAFQAKIHAVRVRCGVNQLLHQAGRVLAAAGGIAALAILAERLLAVRVLAPWSVWAFCGIVLVAILVLWFLKWPSRMQASLLLDERLGLNERVSTTLALAQSDDPFAKAARAESLNVVQYANLAGHFPIRFSRSWAYGAGTWVATIAMVFLLPQRDLLGFLKDREEQQKKAQTAQMTQTQVRKATEQVKAAVRALGDPNLVADLKKLDELGQAAEPPEIKREAIKALGDLSEKIKQMQTGPKAAASGALQQMLKQLRGSSDPLSQQLRMAMAKGDFSKAAGMLAELQKQLNAGTMSEERRQELTAQMQSLAKELEKLSEQKKQIEEELAKLGLDKKLAVATPEQLREALTKQGLSQEKVDQLMKKIEAGQAAAAQCASLGKALASAAGGGGGGGLSAGGMTGAIDQLNALDALQQEAFMLQASLAEVSDALNKLGHGAGLWDISEGGGYDGEGIGLDTVDEHYVTSNALKADKMTKAPSQGEGGPAVASWYFKDTQVKGEAQRPFTEVIQAGRATAAEAMSENQIPRRYEEAVKAYFNQLEQSGPRP